MAPKHTRVQLTADEIDQLVEFTEAIWNRTDPDIDTPDTCQFWARLRAKLRRAQARAR